MTDLKSLSRKISVVGLEDQLLPSKETVQPDAFVEVDLMDCSPPFDLRSQRADARISALSISRPPQRRA